MVGTRCLTLPRGVGSSVAGRLSFPGTVHRSQCRKLDRVAAAAGMVGT